MADFIPADQLLGGTSSPGLVERVKSAFGGTPAQAPTGFQSAESLLGIPAFEQEARKGPSFWESVKNVWARPLEGTPIEPAAPKDFASAAPGEMMYAGTPAGAATGRAKARGTARTGPTVEGDVTELPAIALGTAMQVSDMATSFGKQLLGAAPYWAARTYAAAKGESSKIAAMAGQEAKDYFFPPELSTPWGKVAESMGPEMQKAYTKNPVAWVMEKIGEIVSKGAERAEAGAGIPAEDIMALAEQTMGSLFFKQAIRPKVQEAFTKRVEEFKAKRQAPPEDTGYGENVPQGEPLIIVDSPAQVKEIFRTAAKEGTPAAREAQWVTDIFERAKRGEGQPPMPGAVKESRFEPPKWKAEEFKMPERTGGLYEGAIFEAAPDGTVRIKVPPAFDTAVDKIRTGRAPTMTAEEVLALRENAKIDGDGLIVDPRSGKPFFQRGAVDQKQFLQFMAALGVTGAAAMALSDWYSQDEAGAAAAAAGMGVLGITRGMLMSQVLERLPTSSKVLERLPNRAEFTREQIAQELKRQDVTGPERELIEGIVAGLPGDKISAADLGTRFQQATDRFELKREDTPQYAAYGLDALRSERNWESAAAAGDTKTTLHKLPMAVSDANHFNEPNLFGWTRSFKEDGIRHVVEIQSDLAQHAKQISPEKLKDLERSKAINEEELRQWQAEFKDRTTQDGREQAQREIDKYALRVDELQVAIGNAYKAAEISEAGLEPILKNWPRRLIREELADAARQGEASVRFASADTVAKVEGWPAMSRVPGLERSLQELERQLAWAEQGRAGRSGFRPDVDAVYLRNTIADVKQELAQARKEASVPDFPRFKYPEHASIYQRYAGDITRYLKTLGGKEVTDAEGHTWLEVPTKATGPKAQLWTRPETVAAVGAVTAATLAATDPETLGKLGLDLAGLGAVGAAAMGHIKLKGLSEGELISRARAGGREGEMAFAKLYADNVKQLTRSVNSFERRGIDVEDVVQRSFIKAFDSLKREPDAVGGFRGDSKFSTFLHRIAQNEAMNRVRSAELRPTTEMTPEIEETLGHSNTPEKAALNTVLQQRMQQALDKLPENFRRPFEMRELEGLEYQEIADRLGVPLNTVRTQIHRAKEQLQKNLGDYKNLEAGQIDPELLKIIGGAAAGGLVGYTINNLLQGDSPIASSVWTALAGSALATGAGRRMLKDYISSPDKLVGATSTRLRNIDVSLGDRYVLLNKHILKRVDQLQDQITPFMQELKQLPKEAQQAVNNALLNGRLDEVMQIPALAKTYGGIRSALAGLEAELRSLNRFQEGVTNYFPRLVKDVEGLRQALGVEHSEGLQKVLVEAEAQMNRKEHRSLTEVERSIVIDNYLAKAQPTSYQPGYAKARKVDNVTPELQKFYETPTDSLLRYIAGATADIEKARFFGKDLRNAAKGKKTFIDTEASIGALTNRLLTERKISPEQVKTLRDILDARFGGGEQAMGSGLAAVRNLTNTGLLGNAISAATQVGDSLAAIYHFGMVPTLQAVVEKFTGRERMSPKQLGLAQHVAEELSAQGITGTLQNFAMKWSGFKTIDMFAKGLGINAALLQAAKEVSTPKGEAAFRARYQSTFGEEIGQLIDDLKARRLSDNMEELAFLRLSDAQPISKAEMSEAYLRHPNGRILYQLKTYMLKQADIIRRDVYQKIASGDPKQIAMGLKNLAALGTVYALANVPGDVVKAWMNGQDIDPLSTPRLVENVMQTFGLNRYAQTRLSQGKVVDVLQDFVTPPLKVIEDIALGRPKAVSYVPLVGRIVYNRALGGNERKEIYERMAKPKGERKPLSPAAKKYLADKRAEKKRKELAQ